MPSIKDIKKRITATKNTQQTTKAMKMVSAAKLRRAQDAINSQRPYAKQVKKLIGTLVASPEAKAKLNTPIFQGHEVEGKKKLMLVLFTSDRGLCGGFNANIIKTAQRWVKANEEQYEFIELVFVGKKARDFFKTKNYTLGRYFEELGGKVTFQKAKTLAEAILQDFQEGRVHEVKFIYNEFKNAVSQEIQVEDFLPLTNSTTQSQDAPDCIVKPSIAEMLDLVMAKYFSIQSFRVMLESQASEHGARMSAMENATNNAGDMIRELTLQYNKQRQAGITKELLEIIAGSESQKAS